LLAIGDQSRDDIFALRIPPRRRLCARVVGVDARVDATGSRCTPLDRDALRDALLAVRAAGIESLAVALLHAPQAPEDERAIAALARECGFTTVCASHEVSAEPGLLARAQTAVVEAALQPVLQRYTRGLADALPGARIRLMQSDGHLADAARFQARHSIFSGPAGGVIGATGVAAATGVTGVLGLDMGGTSTDVFECTSRPAVRADATVAGLTVRAPTLELHTVAAGGGSRILRDGTRLRVGPESAGADPGPACYGRGGPPTVTDANIVLGRLHREGFAPVFGPGGDAALDAQAARAAIAALDARSADDAAIAETARGALQLAVEHMAGAVRRISVARGVDIAGHTLVAFGGAGAQHACDVAESLGLSRVLVPARASVLSAVGVGMATVGVTRERTVDLALDDDAVARARAALPELRAQAIADLAEQGATCEDCAAMLRLHYARADTTIDLPLTEGTGAADLALAFADAHDRAFGFADARRPVHVASLHVRVRDRPDEPRGEPAPCPATVLGHQPMMTLADGRWHDAPILSDPGDAGVSGPALVQLAQSSLVLPAGWRATRNPHGITVERAGAAPTGHDSEAARLELFNSRFMHIAAEMGDALRRSAHSVNVRNRLDYSCAVFDAHGSLIANAPHIPVHLGSMSAAVKAIREASGGALHPGDAWLINDPYRGGTHLPDLTLVMPVHDGTDAAPFGFVAARAHHADVGGITPGSMPAESRTIDDEGVRIEGVRVATGGVLLDDTVRALLTGSPVPARDPEANLADLRAQLAACARGARLLAALASTVGVARVSEQMARVQDHAADAVARFIAALADGGHDVAMDDGQHVQLRTSTGDGRLRIDFTGSSAMDPGNANAPLPVVRAAAMYALRCIIDRPVPLNDGFLRHVDLVVPHPGLLSPEPPAAVVAGNVETSQAITDALLVAFGAMAESQGTMNNISFGNDRVQYYETLCGGSGAGPGFDGGDAVHSHMTNSRITDPEIMERQLPVRVNRFAIRHGSGGHGRHRGGNGVVRELRFLEPVELAIISNRRARGARGIAGGGDGAPGHNLLRDPDGNEHSLPARVTCRVAAGSVLRIETPGGGGWGAPRDPGTPT
ncbi:hydantoinase B/oxoprolinase family protein, partial [Algiphilus sp.]|uniref:hydantoinase B/oxoprolinase family protein n=1 Tax=Algiphilus sp. TaxID=1872431 RepID=UPI0025C1C0B2